MRQNLGWAIGYNSLAIPVAAGVFVPAFGITLRAEIAALTMSGSSCLVAVNALLLERLHLPSAEEFADGANTRANAAGHRRHCGRRTDAMTNARSKLDRPIAVVLLAALLLLAGCSRDLDPKSYTAEVQSNYLQNCGAGTKTKLSSTDATQYCDCTYRALVNNVHYDRFREFETYLREHVGHDLNSRADLERDTTYGDIVSLLDGCLP